MRNMKIRKAVQKGFTLLELLVVITILAILATGALLAYEGLTDTAGASAAANNAAVADQSIRNFKAVTGKYPNQWDHLVTDGTEVGLPLSFVSDATYRFLAKVNISDASTQAAITNAFLNVGIDEFQVRTVSSTVPGVEPNLLHNEGAVNLVGGAFADTTIEIEPSDDDSKFFDRLVVVPTVTEDGAALCGVTTAANKPEAIKTDALAAVNNPLNAGNFINKINDYFEAGQCHLIAAFGFGNDAAKSTTGTSVSIASAPTYTSSVINPATTYARYIALFHLGSAPEGNEFVAATDIFQKPKLLAVLDPEGRLVDQNIATARSGN